MKDLKKYVMFNFKYFMPFILKSLIIYLMICAIVLNVFPKNNEVQWRYNTSYILTILLFANISFHSMLQIQEQFKAAANYVVMRKKFYISNIIIHSIIAALIAIFQSFICFTETHGLSYSMKFFIQAFIIYLFFMVGNDLISIIYNIYGIRYMFIYMATLFILYKLGPIYKITQVLMNKNEGSLIMIITFIILIPVMFFMANRLSEKIEI